MGPGRFTDKLGPGQFGYPTVSTNLFLLELNKEILNEPFRLENASNLTLKIL